MTRKQGVVVMSVVMTGLIGLTMSYYVTEHQVVTPGQTVSDPGVPIGHLRNDISILGPEEQASPVNWHEIAQSERPWRWEALSFRFDSARHVFLNYCRRQTGAKITALERFEDEVLVKYSNPEREKDSDNCPTGVVFWFPVKDFLNADSEYREVMKVKAEEEERKRQERDKSKKKLEVVRRYVSPPPDTSSPA